MKICPYCGEKNFDVKTECDKCHRPFVTASVSKRTPMHKIAAAFMIRTTIMDILGMIGSAALWIISLWALNATDGFPLFTLSAITYLVMMVIFLIHALIVEFMRSYYHRKTSCGYPVSTIFKVCTLLFVSLISGILMFSDD